MPVKLNPVLSDSDRAMWKKRYLNLSSREEVLAKMLSEDRHDFKARMRAIEGYAAMVLDDTADVLAQIDQEKLEALQISVREFREEEDQRNAAYQEMILLMLNQPEFGEIRNILLDKLVDNSFQLARIKEKFDLERAKLNMFQGLF